MREYINIIRSESLKCSILGLLSAFLVLSLFTGFSASLETILKWGLNIFIGVFGLMASIWFLSELAGKLSYEGRLNPFITSFSITILSLIGGVFLGSLVGYISEGRLDVNGVENYILTPIIAVLFWGSVPILILIVLLGFRIHFKLKRLNH